MRSSLGEFVRRLRTAAERSVAQSVPHPPPPLVPTEARVSSVVSPSLVHASVSSSETVSPAKRLTDDGHGASTSVDVSAPPVSLVPYVLDLSLSDAESTETGGKPLLPVVEQKFESDVVAVVEFLVQTASINSSYPSLVSPSFRPRVARQLKRSVSIESLLSPTVPSLALTNLQRHSSVPNLSTGNETCGRDLAREHATLTVCTIGFDECELMNEELQSPSLVPTTADHSPLSTKVFEKEGELSESLLNPPWTLSPCPPPAISDPSGVGQLDTATVAQVTVTFATASTSLLRRRYRAAPRLDVASMSKCRVQLTRLSEAELDGQEWPEPTVALASADALDTCQAASPPPASSDVPVVTQRRARKGQQPTKRVHVENPELPVSPVMKSPYIPAKKPKEVKSITSGKTQVVQSVLSSQLMKQDSQDSASSSTPKEHARRDRSSRRSSTLVTVSQAACSEENSSLVEATIEGPRTRAALHKSQSARGQSTSHTPGVKKKSATSTSAKRRRQEASATDSDSTSKDPSFADDGDTVEDARREPRPKGDFETRARDHLMTHPDQLFPDADRVPLANDTPNPAKKQKKDNSDARSRAKTIPTAFVPPRLPANQERAQFSKKKIGKVVKEFITDRDGSLLLEDYQHLERVQIIRALLPITFAGQHDVGPMIRLLRLNGRSPNDPLSLMAAALIPELIDTRQGTQANSAQLTIFNYLVPLFMQRWGVMTAGTAALVQWRSVGQSYNNWNLYGRWPEMFLVAPDVVAQFAHEIFTQDGERATSAFQANLARKFVTNKEALERWCFVRRCARAVNTDTTGASLCIDMVVPPMSVWLRSYDPLAVGAALAAADALALVPNTAERITYPNAEVYRTALISLTRLLACANPNVEYERLVTRSLNQIFSSPSSNDWVEYQGTNETLDAEIQSLRNRPPSNVSVKMISHENMSSSLAVTLHWVPSAIDDTGETLRLVVPVPSETGALCVEAQSSRVVNASSSGVTAEMVSERVDSAASERSSGDATSNSSAVATPEPASAPSNTTRQAFVNNVAIITGLRGKIAEETLCQMLAAFGSVRSVQFDDTAGEVHVVFENSGEALGLLFGVYSTATRARSIRVFTEEAASSVANTEGLRVGATHIFSQDATSLDLATSLLLARSVVLPPIAAVQGAIDIVLALATQRQTHLCAAEEPFASLLESANKLVAVRTEPYDCFGARLECNSVFDDPSSCTSEWLVFCLREVVLEHLQMHPSDVVYVTPPSWFALHTGLEGAANPEPLYLAGGAAINVGRSRLLLCPTFFDKEPVLLFVAFPESLDHFTPKLVPPFIIVFGRALSSAAIQKLLEFLFIRLEVLLGTTCAIVRPSVAVVKLKNVLPSTPASATFDAFIHLAFAARTLLHLCSTADCFSFRSSFFTDASLISTFKTTLRKLMQDNTGNLQMANITTANRDQVLEERRVLASLTKSTKVLVWNDGDTTLAYTNYVIRHLLRVQRQRDWSSSAAMTNFLNVHSPTTAYELISCELRDGSQLVIRACCARLQQLHQRGFGVIGSTNGVIDLCRKATEHVSLALPDFSIRNHEKIYSDNGVAKIVAQLSSGRLDEKFGAPIGWGSPPVGNY